MIRLWRVLLLLLLLSLASCGKSDEDSLVSFPISVEVTDEKGNPIVAVPVQFDSAIVGYTDANGRFRAHVKRPVGSSLDVSVGKIKDYVYSTATSHKVKLETRTVSGAETPTAVLFAVRANSTKQKVWVWIQTTCLGGLMRELCAGLPVEVNGKIYAYTDAAGLAQLYLTETIDSEITIRIDTPSAGEILRTLDRLEGGKSKKIKETFAFAPPSPRFTLKVSAEPKIYTINLPFSDALAEQKRLRLLAAEKKKEETKEEKKKVSRRKKAARRKKYSKKKSKTKKRTLPSKKTGIINVF